MHLRILRDHQNQVLKKLLFSHLDWFKTCFDAFPDQQNQTCFYAFKHHQIQVLKKLFFYVWSGYKRVLMHILTTRIKSLKNYFLTSGEVQNVFFYAFAQTSRPPESSP